MSRSLLLLLALAACAHGAPPASSPTPSAPQPPAALARLRAVAGAGWATDRVLAITGTASIGGMTGSIASIEDAATGRHRAWMHLGALVMGDGFDGDHAWEASPDGAIAITDAPAALARARTAAWLARRGYLRDDGARWGTPTPQRDGDRGYQVVEVTPDGGAPIALWIDDATGALARTVEHDGVRTIVTTFRDWRAAAGSPAQVPHTIVIDDGDARNTITITATEVALRAPVADDSYAPPRTDDRVTFANGATHTELPLELVNNHIYVAAEVDGEQVRMIVDTGGLNMLTPAAAKRLGLTIEGTLGGGGVGAEKVDYGLTRGKRLRVGDATLADPVFFVIDTGVLADVEGVDFDGIIGFEMFTRLAVRIDYPGQRLTLARPGTLTPQAGAIAVPFTLKERTPIVAGAIDWLPATFTIDTGSRTSLTVTAPFIKAHDLIAKYHPRFETTTGWGVGGGVRSSPVRFVTVAIGDATIRGVAGDLFTGDKGAFADTEAAGNVGSGLLRRFVVTFEYVDGRMYLAPGPAADAPDPYDRSGLFLIRAGDALRVVSVAPGSAAATIGIAADDRVLAIDGAPVGSRPLAAWRARFTTSPVGTRIKLTVERAGKRRDAVLVLSELLP